MRGVSSRRLAAAHETVAKDKKSDAVGERQVRWITRFSRSRAFSFFSLSLSLFMFLYLFLLGTGWCEKIRAPLSLSCLLVFPLADFSLGQLYRSLSDFATKASTYGTYEMLVEDEVEHACKLMSLSDPQKRTRKACDKYVQEHTDDIVETYLQKVTEAKKFIAGFDNVEERKMEIGEKGQKRMAEGDR